ncbi:MAG: hypothetical protein COA69_02995 [Robiginitomaculum sp.]|nr:MAG: hypothetical protein COA69_02995 [Robiginitomaculum sp.]
MIQAGLAPDLLEQMDTVAPFDKVVRLMELSAQSLDRPSFGLERALSLPSHFPNLGPIVHLSYFVRNVDGFLSAGLRYWHFHTNAFYFNIIDPKDSHEISLRMLSTEFYPLGPQIVDTFLANLVMLTRVVTNKPNEAPERISVKHARPSDISFYEKVFKCPIEFDASYNEIIFNRAILKYETIMSLSALRPVMEKYISLRLSRMLHYDNSFPTTVSMIISGLLGTGNCNKPNVAAILCIGEKKMQRLLTKHQTSFRAILDETRKSTATSLIEDTNVSFVNISGLLDYQTQPAFNAAFVRWHGCSPSKYRSSTQNKPM